MSAPGYQTATQTGTLTAGTPQTQPIALTPTPPGSITRTVTDAKTSAAIPGAGVSYAPGGGSTTTDTSGNYTFSSVSPGTYTLTESATGYQNASQTVTVVSGQTTATQPVALTSAVVFSDDFESGTMANWNTSTGLSPETTTVHAGKYATEGKAAKKAMYARKTLSTSYQDLYYRSYFDLASATTTVSLMADRTSGGTSMVRLYIDTQGRLNLQNDVKNLTYVGPSVTLGGWHSLELHVTVKGASSSTEVWLDGTPVSPLSLTIDLGTAGGTGEVQLGENKTARTYDVFFDDLVVSLSRIGT